MLVKIKLVWMVFAAILLVGCAQKHQEGQSVEEQEVFSGEEERIDTSSVYVETAEIENINIEEEAEVLEEALPAVPILLETEASGELEKRNEAAVIDYSNTSDGYVMVQYLQETANKLKVQVKGTKTTYTYNLPAQKWVVFPLSDGNGNYQVTVYENIEGNRYAMALAESFSVELSDEFAPFIRPNQYVDYSEAEKTIQAAAKLVTGIEDTIQKVEKVYDFVVETISYDEEKARNVKSGYLPVLDEVMETQKGICFDYAALMTGMLRSQGIPCKLVVGYAGSSYHAWIHVWTEENGWVDGIIYFDSHSWHRMDPTFASSGGQSEEIMEYIGDGTNYTEKYLY